MYYGARYYDPVIGRFTSVDPVVADSGRKEFVQAFLNPQLHNAYSYVGNNPLKYVDPTGEILDTVLDVGFIIYDVYKVTEAVITGGDVKGEAISLGLDAGGAIIPGVTGLGLAARAVRAEKVADKAVDLIKAADKASGATKAVKAEQRSSNALRTEARIINPTKAESTVWKELGNYRGELKTNGLQGKKREYYEWDKAKNHIEAYDRQGKHIGVKDPVTGQLDNSAKVKGRNIKDKL